jgi:SAM-dependent methyltransferase
MRALVPRRLRVRAPQKVRRLGYWPAVGAVRFGSLRRTFPFSRAFGEDRGQPIDRYYIDLFLEEHLRTSDGSRLMRGRVLEVGEPRYVNQFARREDLDEVDIVDFVPTPDATLVGDLTDSSVLPSAAFDCVICTQTLQYIYDVRAAVRNLHNSVKPGGHVILTVPGITQACRSESGAWRDQWRFTAASLRRLLEEGFDAEDIVVTAYGNVHVAAAFLFGLAVEDVASKRLAVRDPDYELVICAKAVKRAVVQRRPS